MSEDDETEGDQGIEDYVMASTSKFELFRQDVEYHDEVHAVVADVGEQEFREKDCSFQDECGIVTVDNGVTFRRYDISEIVYWYPPRDF